MNTSDLLFFLTVFLILGSTYFLLGIVEKFKFLTRKEPSDLGLGFGLLSLLPLINCINNPKTETKKEEQK